MRWQRQNWFDLETIFCVILYKLSYPVRLFKLVDYFRYSLSYLSYITHNLIEYLVEQYNSLLEWYPSLMYKQIKEYAKSCKESGELQEKSTI